MIKKVQHISTMFPIGLSDDNNVCTTNFKPGALFITLKGLKDLSNLNTWNKNFNFGKKPNQQNF